MCILSCWTLYHKWWIFFSNLKLDSMHSLTFHDPVFVQFFDRQRLFTTIFNPTRLANGEGSTLGILIFDVELVSIRRSWSRCCLGMHVPNFFTYILNRHSEFDSLFLDKLKMSLHKKYIWKALLEKFFHSKFIGKSIHFAFGHMAQIALVENSLRKS